MSQALSKRRVPTGSNCTEQVAGSVMDHRPAWLAAPATSAGFAADGDRVEAGK